MLSRLLGAALVLFSCASVGLRRCRELRERVRTLDALLRGVELLRGEICRLQTPLPLALRRLAAEEGSVFAPLAEAERALQERPFSLLWDEWMAAAGLAGAETEALGRLGRALCTADAERGLAVCEEVLRELRRRSGEEAAVKCRLCVTLGFCAGALAVILLL